MINFSDILYEVYEHLKTFEEQEVLDEDLIRGWAINALKQFGNLVTVDKSQALVVSNYRATVPYYYYSFQKAKKCGVTEYEVQGNPPQIITQTVMKIREEFPIEDRQFVEHLDPNGKYKKIVETLYLNTPNTVKATIVKGGEIELVTAINRDLGCDVSEADKSYAFKLTGSRMAIRGDVIDTDFKEGVIYLEYRGYPETDEGELLIRDGGSNKMRDYIFYHLMRKTYTHLWTNYNKDVVTRIQHFTVLENQSLSPAMSAMKAEGIAGGQYIPGIKRKNQKRFSKYDRF